jgi:hypothetical protein
MGIWRGSPENTHYWPLAQINRANVKQLEVAWSFDTGEPGGLQTSSIIVDGVLYGITPDSNTMIGSTPETRTTLLTMRWSFIVFGPFLWPIEDWQIVSPATMADELLGEYPGEI